MTVTIGSHQIGDGPPGLRHRRDRPQPQRSVDLAKKLIDVAADAGAQAVKFQKRTPEISTPEHMKSVLRETPWGEMTYLEYRYRVEFDREQYIEIGDYATLRGLDWFASPWDVPAVEFLEDLNVVAHKVASASVTDLELLAALAATGKPVILSTGMSTMRADRRGRRGARHRQPGHPARDLDLPAAARGGQPPDDSDPPRRYPGVPIGYSGHERGLQISLAAVALGAHRRRAPHHARPRDVGLRPRGLARADRASSTWCATSGSSRRPWATASSGSSRASSRRWPSCAASRRSRLQAGSTA